MRQVALLQVMKQDLCSFYRNQTLASNIDLMGYSSLCVCLVTNGAKDGILVHSDWYHASKVHLLYLSIIWQTLSPIFPIKHMCKLQSKLLAHMQGEQLLPYGVHVTCPYTLHMVNMLGQATWIQMNFNSYLCERVVINYQKGGD